MTEKIIDQLAQVRDDGSVNMMFAREVQVTAHQMGFSELVVELEDGSHADYIKLLEQL